MYTENCGLDNVLMSFGHDGTIHSIPVSFIELPLNIQEVVLLPPSCAPLLPFFATPCTINEHERICTEYMYRVLAGNEETARRLPRAALDIIRYHSFYPWHHDGAYRYFLNEKDHEALKWVRIFQYGSPSYFHFYTHYMGHNEQCRIFSIETSEGVRKHSEIGEILVKNEFTFQS